MQVGALVYTTSWINWTNLMSLYEIFYCSTCFECYYTHPQELATICGCVALFRCVLAYWCGSAGVGLYLIAGWSTSATPAEPHQYTPKQSNTPIYSRQLLRMSVIALETCWAIKTFIKWHQVGSIYSATKMVYFHSHECSLKTVLFYVTKYGDRRQKIYFQSFRFYLTRICNIAFL